MKSEARHILATLTWVAVGILALILIAPDKPAAGAMTAPEALAHEVAVQCAGEVGEALDASGATDVPGGPSPLHGELVAMCAAEFDKGANYAEAPVAVLAGL